MPSHMESTSEVTAYRWSLVFNFYRNLVRHNLNISVQDPDLINATGDGVLAAFTPTAREEAVSPV